MVENGSFTVLWRSKCLAISPPTEPPTAHSHNKLRSDSLCCLLRARLLSIAKAAKQMVFTPAK